MSPRNLAAWVRPRLMRSANDACRSASARRSAAAAAASVLEAAAAILIAAIMRRAIAPRAAFCSSVAALVDMSSASLILIVFTLTVTTAADAFWLDGPPWLALTGERFDSRLSSSVLQHTGLGSLRTASMRAFEDMGAALLRS